jgi:hypothetical protein
MRYLFKKVQLSIVVIVIAMVVSTVGGPFSRAAAAESPNNENLQTQQSTNYNPPISLNNQSVILLEDELAEVEPYVIPLLVAVVLRVGVSVVARISAGATVRVTAHAATRAVERGMSSGVLNQSLSYGTRYKDAVTGARITWDSSSKAAAVINADNSIATVYFQNAPKAVWQLNNWAW